MRRPSVRKDEWTSEMVMDAAKSYTSRQEFISGHQSAARAARRMGVMTILFPKTLRGTKTKVVWDEYTVAAKASLYSSRVEFYRGSPSAYNAAKKMNLLGSLYGFVRDQWDGEAIRNEASKYEGRLAFCRGCGSGYAAALRLNMMDELFPERIHGTDNDVVYIWEVAGEVFNGNPVYKIGITSARLGRTRIDQVVKGSNSRGFREVCMKKVVVPAKHTEKKILALGVSPLYSGFNGSSEFRSLSPSELMTALEIVEGARQ